jgi:hypothetical protein
MLGRGGLGSVGLASSMFRGGSGICPATARHGKGEADQVASLQCQDQVKGPGKDELERPIQKEAGQDRNHDHDERGDKDHRRQKTRTDEKPCCACRDECEGHTGLLPVASAPRPACCEEEQTRPLL